MIFRLYSILLLALFSSQSTQAQGWQFIDTSAVTICPAHNNEERAPDFTADACSSTIAKNIDPQNRLIWVKTKLNLENTTGSNGEPLSLFVSGKMSSEFYVNGQFIGQNGTPSANADSEKVGTMDAVIHFPQTILRAGVNDIVFKASSYHGFLHLGHPVHWIAIGPTASVNDVFLRHYWPSILMLGIFVLGAIYFAIVGLLGISRTQTFSLCLISSFAAAQLVSEILRGLIAYDYPTHDLRLIAITFFSIAFGVSVAFYTFYAFSRDWALRATALLTLLTVAIVSQTPSFDSKAELGMLTPVFVAMIASCYWVYRKRSRAVFYMLTLLGFCTCLVVFSSIFLDIVFYYLVAGFLLTLFIEQGFELANEGRLRRQQTARADKLELALEQARERNQISEVKVKSAGSIQRIASNTIVRCQGASGYTEITTETGETLLHSQSLAEMERDLPQTFLRVHRSHIVNTEFVRSLERDPSGTGSLVMENQDRVPVSRRVMPHVRQALQ